MNTNFSGAGVRFNDSKEVAVGDDAKPTPAPLDAFYLMRLNMELASAGFAADRKPPRTLYEPPRPRARRVGCKRTDPAYDRAYRQQLRAKWLEYGIVRPKNDAERAWLAGRAE